MAPSGPWMEPTTSNGWGSGAHPLAQNPNDRIGFPTPHSNFASSYYRHSHPPRHLGGLLHATSPPHPLSACHFHLLPSCCNLDALLPATVPPSSVMSCFPCRIAATYMLDPLLALFTCSQQHRSSNALPRHFAAASLFDLLPALLTCSPQQRNSSALPRHSLLRSSVAPTPALFPASSPLFTATYMLDLLPASAHMFVATAQLQLLRSSPPLRRKSPVGSATYITHMFAAAEQLQIPPALLTPVFVLL